MDPFERLRTALADRYAVKREIGRGGMAIVYLAHDLKHDRDVAIKLLKPEFAMAVSAERFLREIQIEAQLKHPYILPLFDSGEADGLLYYVMPYVAGRSLQARLSREIQLPIAEALRITSEIAEALAYAHTHRVVHRDVKPGNILLDDNHALLADFGIARAVTELGGSGLSDSGMVVGTPEYMSPEQCAHAGNLDGRSDIYALGCVLYQMLSGEPPFTGATAQAIVARHLHEQPRSLRVVRTTIPEHVEEAVQVALAKVPADRFTTAIEFVAALDPQGDTAPAIRRARAARRRRARQTAAIVAGAAVVGSLSVWMVSEPAGPQVTAAADSSAAPALSSIAVLYLQDRSEGGRLGHLAAGLTEDLIDRLAAVRALRVISPDGIRAYRGKDIPLDSLARIFKVGTIVTGTIRGGAGRLRASVRLTEPASGVQLFSGDFERPYRDVLALSDELAEEVARQLRIRLGEAIQLRERRSRTTNAVAWDLVLRAEQIRNDALDLPSKDSLAATRMYREADSLAARAERLDPAWIEPTLMRGWLAYDLADRAAVIRGHSGQRSYAAMARWIDRGIDYATQGLRKRPGAPEALELRGSLIWRGWALSDLGKTRNTKYGLASAERDLREAASVPHRHQARTLSTLSAVQQFLGKLPEANVAANRAYEADAYLRDASAIVLRLFETSLNLKRYAEAADWCERGRRTFPKEWVFLMCQLNLMAWSPTVRPDVERAWRVLGELDQVASPDVQSWAKPQMTMIVASVIARAALRDSSEQVIARARAAGGADPDMPYYEALARVRLGQSDEAAQLLRDILRQSPTLLPVLRSEAPFSGLWDQPQLRLYQ